MYIIFVDYETVFDIAYSYKRITNMCNKTQYKLMPAFKTYFEEEYEFSQLEI
jgi:hypothetical protein